MGKNRTPLLAPMRKSSATMYTFPSAVEDIGLNINERNNKVVLSNYVTLNIPTIYNEKSAEDSSKGMYLQDIAGIGYEETDVTKWLRDSLQNYVMNFETIIRNQSAYDYSASATVSEKIFWKWLQKIGGIDLSEEDTINKTKFYHEDWNDASTSTIKGFGQINTSSQQSNSYNTTTKTYVMIPSSYGQMKCLLKSTTDNNYERGLDYYSSYLTFLEGYSDEQHMGYFDSTDDGGYGKYKVSEYKDLLNFSFDTVDYMNVLNDSNPDESFKLLKKPSIDDLAIDSTLRIADSYDFNTLLIYYTIYDSAGNTVATNLFGVMFLNGITANEDGTAFIESYTKKSSTDGDFGSSFSFILDIKTASIYDNTQAPIIDYSSGDNSYMNDFNSVLTNLTTAVELMENNSAIIAKAYNDTQTVKELFVETNDSYQLIDEDLQHVLNTFDVDTIDASFEKLFTGIEDASTRIAAIPIFDADEYYDKDTSDKRFVLKTELEEDYYTKEETDASFYSKDQIDASFYDIQSADAIFWKKSELDVNDYLSKTEADKVYVKKEDLESLVVDILVKYNVMPDPRVTPTMIAWEYKIGDDGTWTGFEGFDPQDSSTYYTLTLDSEVEPGTVVYMRGTPSTKATVTGPSSCTIDLDKKENYVTYVVTISSSTNHTDYNAIISKERSTDDSIKLTLIATGEEQVSTSSNTYIMTGYTDSVSYDASGEPVFPEQSFTAESVSKWATISEDSSVSLTKLTSEALINKANEVWPDYQITSDTDFILYNYNVKSEDYDATEKIGTSITYKIYVLNLSSYTQLASISFNGKIIG